MSGLIHVHDVRVGDAVRWFEGAVLVDHEVTWVKHVTGPCPFGEAWPDAASTIHAGGHVMRVLRCDQFEVVAGDGDRRVLESRPADLPLPHPNFP